MHMRNWENQRKQKIHEAKIRNARPTIPQAPPGHLESTPVKPAARLSISDTQLYTYLKSYNIQQYYKKLADMGFADDPYRLAYLSHNQQDDLFREIKTMPGHRAKFEDLFSLLRSLAPESYSRASTSTGKQRSGFSSTHHSDSKKSRTAAANRRQHPAVQSQKDALDLLNNMPVAEDYYENLRQAEEEKEQQRIRQEIEEANRIIEELQKKLDAQRQRQENRSPVIKKKKVKEIPKPKPPDSPLSKYKAVIPEVGVSYDSSKMRSTIVHIDIEEMCRCLSEAVRRHVIHGMQQEQVVQNTAPSVQSSLVSLPDFLAMPQQHPLNSVKSRGSHVSSFGSLNYSVDSDADSLCNIEPPADDIKLQFEEEFEDLTVMHPTVPTDNDIYNFVKNFMLRCQLEKECSILCLVYIERLIKYTGFYVNARNWKKVTLISLILASKIWDDESFENKHFAEAFTLFPIHEINSAESLFLHLINFDITIKSSEYAKYYFILREYASHANKSFPLQPLDVDTVMRLQGSASRGTQELRENHELLRKTMTQLIIIFYRNFRYCVVQFKNALSLPFIKAVVGQVYILQLLVLSHHVFEYWNNVNWF